ncbi:transcriptional repressor [bacterium]|nr:transcriptional repressor [bacterium]
MARRTPRRGDDDIEAVRARIRGAGLRCTAARLAVMQYLISATGPLTHAEVSEAVGPVKGFDRATIYRNLTELTEAGLVSRVELGDHVWRFELKRAGHAHAKGEDHPHFLCTSCGAVSCLDDVDIAITPKPGRGTPAGRGKAAKKAAARSGGIRSVQEILLKGQCGKCVDG